MRHTLARLLTAALVYLTKLNTDDINVQDYCKWLDEFPVGFRSGRRVVEKRSWTGRKREKGKRDKS